MFSCKHCGEKRNVYLPSHSLSSSISHHSPFFAITLCPFTSIHLSATFPHPPVLYSISASLPFTLCPTAFHHPPSPPPLSTFPIIPPFPPSHPLPLPLSPSSRSLPFFAQDRSALITLMALMIQLNGALSPRCLSKASLCSLLMQQHSAVTAALARSLWTQ